VGVCEGASVNVSVSVKVDESARVRVKSVWVIRSVCECDSECARVGKSV